MTKDDDQAGDGVPLHRSDCCLIRDREAPVGDASFEAPKRPRTTVQIVTFEKARAKCAEILAKKGANKPAPELEPERTPPPGPEPAPTPALAPRRKPRSDAWKRRGRLVMYDEYLRARGIEGDSFPGESEISSAPPPHYNAIVW